MRRCSGVGTSIPYHLRRIYDREFGTHLGQEVFSAKRFRMREAENLSSPLHHAMYDGLGFEQIVACVETNKGSPFCSADRR